MRRLSQVARGDDLVGTHAFGGDDWGVADRRDDVGLLGMQMGSGS